MSDFLAMGGYAAFVWPAYGVSIVGLAAMIAATLRAHRHARRRLDEIVRSRTKKPRKEAVD